MPLHYSKDAEDIVTLTMDTEDSPVNLIDETFLSELAEAVGRLEDEPSLAGVILESAKDSFVAGADMAMLERMSEPPAAFDAVEGTKATLRRLETLGHPVVAALNGTALGGGLELALACHHRIALDRPSARFGFPEVTFGLLPGGGGVTRLTRMLGLQDAFAHLTEGRQMDPGAALEAGIIDELTADSEQLLSQARAWIRAHPDSAQPWDQKGFHLPGGDPNEPAVAQMVSMGTAMILKTTRGNYPAPMAILSAMVEGASVEFDTASRIESRYFTGLVTGSVAKNMIRAFWFQMNEIKKGRSRPEDIPLQEVHKVGILGAGLMGHGIAYVTALSGIEVVLKDVSKEKAEEGKARAARLLEDRVRKGRLGPEAQQTALARIDATDEAADLAGCDLVIEAVFEDRAVKAAVTRETEAVLADDAVFASNTSTLPITSLAAASERPANFIGLHFFSPVHRMKLVEIIVGEQTAERTLAKAFDFVRRLGKTPIVVNDSRGFFTSRVFTTYVDEGMALLTEGQHPRAIESAGLQAGLPMGPLAVSDEVNLGLAMHVREQTRKDLAADGRELPRLPSDEVLEILVNQEGRAGKAQGAGFYAYSEGGEKSLWSGLAERFPLSGSQYSQAEMIDRLLFHQALEAVRCLDEGVVTSVADANIGSILGWGFPAFKGGVLQYINDYGLPAFVARAEDLASRWGTQFDPPKSLVRMAERGETFI
jgi:3-hydroxyacyl-CoA dehydrogenase/enoyl-CoA hydratase/3-hydroxybutyryl-CoA epimerase